MRRREFMAGLAGAATWPVVARAQQGDRVRRIGVLMTYDENDPLEKRRYSAFTQALADLGWIDGRNVRVDLQGTGGDINRIRALAQKLVSLKPPDRLDPGDRCPPARDAVDSDRRCELTARAVSRRAESILARRPTSRAIGLQPTIVAHIAG
jgi:hypothetical protein